MNKKPKAYFMDYDELLSHQNCDLELNEVWDWQTNRPISIEIRCKNCETEPLFEIDRHEEGE